MMNDKFIQILFDNIISGRIDREIGAKLLEELAMKSNVDSSYGGIAVIGAAVKLPIADNLDEFWEFICNGGSCAMEFPESRQSDVRDYLDFIEKFDTEEFAKGAYLDAIDKFDFNFFNLSPREAKLMSPNQRIFLETSWAAIEDAGYGGDKLAGSLTGVFLGLSSDELFSYSKFILDIDASSISAAMPGNLTAITASRLSYLLNLRGPSMVIDTACSSSLVAVHLACQALKNGDCETAIAGGIRTNLIRFKGLPDLGIHADKGRTRTFDENSDGTSCGEGAIVVVLKPLSNAVRDKDNIYAVIRGSAVNQDGHSVGITAPSAVAQEEVLQSAWKNAGINPETIAYIEAHGTGTKLGDSIEVEGINRAFEKYTNRKQFCAIGTVKTNLGHLDHASGAAGLVKAVLMLKNRVLPPIANFNRPNWKIDFENSPVYVNDERANWTQDSTLRRCGVSAFGISGTNCHVVLEEYEDTGSKQVTSDERQQIFTLSAKSIKSLEKLVDKYKSYIDKQSSIGLYDICYTANTGRGQYNYRLAIVSKDEEEFKNKTSLLNLQDFNCNRENGIFIGRHKLVEDSKKVIDKYEITRKEKNELNLQLDSKIQDLSADIKCYKDLLKEICDLYVKGGDIDWDKFYMGNTRKKVSLPTYPFERNRCWIDIPLKEKTIREENDGYLYELNWESKDLRIKKPSKGTTLIFRNAGAIGEQFVSILSSNGSSVIDVVVGSSYEKVSENLYFITNSLSDYESLFGEIKDKSVAYIVHLLTITEKKGLDTLEQLEQNIYIGVHSLFYISKAITRCSIEDEIDLLLISQYANSVTCNESRINPENAAFFGLGKAINWEILNLNCRCIDIDECSDINKIIFELYAKNTNYKVAYRNDVRYVELLKKVDYSSSKTIKTEIKNGGVYVITGGLGSIGLEVARYFACKNKVNLVLVNRSIMPEREEWNSILGGGKDKKYCRIIRAINEIEQMGSKVWTYSADVSNLDQMQVVMNSVRRELGGINGIIHGAGTGGGTLVEIETEDNVNKVLAPKVKGTWILNYLTKSDNLDFFIMFSSAITVTGGLGGGSYTIANCYLDSFAAYRAKLEKRTLTVNWPVWDNAGLSEGIASYQENQLFKTIKSEKAMEIFGKAIDVGLHQIIVGELNYRSLIFNHNKLPFNLGDDININANTSKRDKILGSFVKNICADSDIKLVGRESGKYSDTEKQIGSIWASVLGFHELNIYDNFFELGGDSLIASRIIKLLSKKMNITIEISDFFKNLSIESMAVCLEKGYLNNNISVTEYPELIASEKRDYYPLSSAQKRLFILHQMDKEGTHYNEPAVMRIEGRINKEKLDNAIHKLIKRHDALRTSFDFAEGEPVQIVNDNLRFNIEFSLIQETEVENCIRKFIKPFDLSKAPLLRIQLATVTDEKHYLMFDMHHIISDAISLQILVNDFKSLYEGVELIPLRIQYKDFTLWQNRFLITPLLKKQEKYWLDIFSDQMPCLDIPLDFDRPLKRIYEGEKVCISVEGELLTSIRNLSKDTGATPFMILVTAYYILLHKYSTQEDIIIGIPVAGRSSPELENIIGVFVNTLALRNKPKGNKSVRKFINEIKESLLKSYENQDFQFEELVEKLKIPRDIDKNPLFSTMITMHSFGIESMGIGELKFIPYDFDKRTTKFDFELGIVESETALSLTFRYCKALFKRDTADEMIKSFIEILNIISRNVDVFIKDIEIIQERNNNAIVSKVIQARKEIMKQFEFN